jgi:Peptidase family S41
MEAGVGPARVREMNRRQLLRAATIAGPSFSAVASAQAAEGHTSATSEPPPPALRRDSPLSARDLRSDLALIDRIYRDMHPGLTRYQTLDQWRDAVALLDSSWATRSEHRLEAAYLEMSRLLARVRCGHSYANFYNQRRSVAQALFEGRDRLPLTFVWLGQRMVVTGGALRPGTEVLAIDEVPTAQLLARLLPLVRSDGHNDAKRRALLSVDAREGFETFDIFHALTAGARHRFVLNVREPGTGPRRVELPAIDLDQRRAMNPRKPAPPSDEAPPWTLSYDAERNAVLTMPGWALYNSKWDWVGWLERKLDEVVEMKAPRLLVDLRRNEGGLDCGDVILARCIERPLLVRAEERLVRYRRVADELNPVLDSWDNRFRDWGERAQPVADRPGFFRLVPIDPSAETGGKTIEPRGPRFTGKLRVLTSSTNSSATFRFVSLVREHGLGRTIGGATGGNQRGINGGAFFFVRLPGTGLEVDLPLIGYYPRGPLRPDAGLEPDLAVTETIEDITEGRDRVMEAASRT